MYQKADKPVDVYNYVDNKVDMHKFRGSYFDRCATWLRMDEMAGTVAKDWSFNDNDGTIIGGTWTAAGKFHHCLTFDGADDHINIPTTLADSMGKATIEFWIKPDVLGDYDGLYGVFTDAGNKFQIMIIASGKIRNYFKVGGAVIINSLDTAGTVDTTNWWHIVAIFTGTRYKIYINSSLANGLDTACANTLSDIASSTHHSIASLWDGAWYRYVGKMDEFRIYHRVLTADEIRKRYEIGRGPP